MKRLARLNVGILVALLVASYLVYALLLQENFLHASIGDIIQRAHELKPQKHMLVLGILPVYIGTIVFGSAMLGIYLGSLLQRRILKSRNDPFRLETHLKL